MPSKDQCVACFEDHESKAMENVVPFGLLCPSCLHDWEGWDDSSVSGRVENDNGSKPTGPSTPTETKPSLPPVKHAGPSTSTTTHPVSSTLVKPAKLCRHFRQVLPVGQGKVLHLSASMGMPRVNQWDLFPKPTFSVYLASQWLAGQAAMVSNVPLPWTETLRQHFNEHKIVYVDWPDMGTIPVPMLQGAVGVVQQALFEDETVEIGCTGGHGRTGTLAACVLVAQGIPAEDAIKYVRERYCPDALDNAKQEALVQRYAEFKESGR